MAKKTIKANEVDLPEGIKADDDGMVTLSRRQIVTHAARIKSRLQMAADAGQVAYGGLRDYATVLGYKRVLEFKDYIARYERQDIAGAVVDKPAIDTWRRPPAITEGGKDDTDFVTAWDALAERLDVWDVFSRLDRLTGLGEFGVLLIGVNAAGKMKSPLKDGALKGQEDIIYLRPLSEGMAGIDKVETDATSPRFGRPTMYKIEVVTAGSDKGVVIRTESLHWSRTVHVVDGKLSSEIRGTPRLKPVWNLLDDLLKLVGGSAEATWLNMRPGTVITNREGYDFPDDDESVTLRAEQVTEYLHGQARMMMLEGVDVKTQMGRMLDPSNAVGVVVQMISARTRIPQSELLGSAAGELASAKEDSKRWAGTISSRQIGYAETQVLRAFIKRLQELGALPPTPEGFEIGTLNAETGRYEWPSILQLDDLEKAAVSKTKAEAANTLRDPFTGRTPLTPVEERELLGVPPLLPADQAANMAAGFRANSQANYAKEIRAATRGLWGGDLDLFDFSQSMAASVRRNLLTAWNAGLRAAGIAADEITPAEETVRDLMIGSQIARIDGYGDYVAENNKASGKPASLFAGRINLWSQYWLTVFNRAMEMGQLDGKLRFNLGPAEKHCSTCLKLDGKVKRKSQWAASGLGPQSDLLECVRSAGGINNVCKCSWSATDEPMSKGPLPRA